MTVALTALEQLEASKKQLAGLAERRTRIQVQLESARQMLADARKRAEAEYGTADVTRLREILAERDRTNTEAVGQFKLAVTEFDAFINRIEQAMANPGLAAEPAKSPATADEGI